MESLEVSQRGHSGDTVESIVVTVVESIVVTVVESIVVFYSDSFDTFVKNQQ